MEQFRSAIAIRKGARLKIIDNTPFCKDRLVIVQFALATVVLLCSLFGVAASTPSYWFQGLQSKPDAKQASAYWFLEGTNILFTYTNNRVVINSTGGGGGGGGTNGAPGINGTNGAPGLNGTNGLPGLNGTNGVNGGGTNVSNCYHPFTNTLASGCLIWLTAEKGVYKDYGTNSATVAGDPVNAWFDQSGNGINFTNPSTGTATTPFYQPCWTPNGYPALYVGSFAGTTNSRLMSKTISGLTYPIYTFAVIKGTGTFMDGQTSSTRMLLQCGSSWQIYAGNGLSTAFENPNDWYLATFYYSGGSTSFYRINGHTINTGSAGSQNPAALTLGSDYAGAGSYPFWLAEVQMYTNNISATYTNIEAGLRAKYNLY